MQEVCHSYHFKETFTHYKFPSATIRRYFTTHTPFTHCHNKRLFPAANIRERGTMAREREYRLHLYSLSRYTFSLRSKRLRHTTNLPLFFAFYRNCDRIGNLRHFVSLQMQFRIREEHIGFFLQRDKVHVDMVHLHT